MEQERRTASRFACFCHSPACRPTSLSVSERPSSCRGQGAMSWSVRAARNAAGRRRSATDHVAPLRGGLRHLLIHALAGLDLLARARRRRRAAGGPLGALCHRRLGDVGLDPAGRVDLDGTAPERRLRGAGSGRRAFRAGDCEGEINSRVSLGGLGKASRGGRNGPRVSICAPVSTPPPQLPSQLARTLDCTGRGCAPSVLRGAVEANSYDGTRGWAASSLMTVPSVRVAGLSRWT